MLFEIGLAIVGCALCVLFGAMYADMQGYISRDLSRRLIVSALVIKGAVGPLLFLYLMH
jgi:hypothetical protein